MPVTRPRYQYRVADAWLSQVQVRRSAASPMNSASSSRSSSPSVRRSSRTSCAGGHAIDVVGRRTDGAPPLAAERGVGAAAEAKPLAFLPVFQIVTRTARRPAGPRSKFHIARIRRDRAAPALRDTSPPHHRPAPPTSRRAPSRPAAAHSGKSRADTATRGPAADVDQRLDRRQPVRRCSALAATSSGRG